MADTTVYQQVTDLMEGKPEMAELKPVILALATGQDRANTMLLSTRKLLFTAITTTLTLTVAICGLILQLSNQ